MLIIRHAGDKDLNAMNELLSMLFSIETDFSPNGSLQIQGLTMMLSACSETCVLVAEEKGNVVGMATIQKLISTAEGGPVGLLEDMVVDKAHQNKGVGKRVLNALETWAQKNNLTRLQLLADKKNKPALDFYSRNGWEETDLICLRKKLHPEQGCSS